MGSRIDMLDTSSFVQSGNSHKTPQLVVFTDDAHHFAFRDTSDFTRGGVVYDPEASITGLYTGPYFDPLAPRNLTAHIGDRAVLPCTVRQLGDKSVSWVRMRDADILTVDRYTFVGDERFEAQYSSVAETWNLIINYVQIRDAGDYECQVSTEPKMSQFFNLRVVVPQINIEPPDDRHVKAGSKVRIDCHITDVVEMPDYIFWYHDARRVLARTDRNLDVTLTRTGEESIMSSLHIERVEKKQSGNYTCLPSNLHGAFTLLHVLNEEHPAAMQDGRNSAAGQRVFSVTLFLTLCLLLLIYLQTSDRLKCFSRQGQQMHPSRMLNRLHAEDKTDHCRDKILSNTLEQTIQKPGSELLLSTSCVYIIEYIKNKYAMGQKMNSEYYVIRTETPHKLQNVAHSFKVDHQIVHIGSKTNKVGPAMLHFGKHEAESHLIKLNVNNLIETLQENSSYTIRLNMLPLAATAPITFFVSTPSTEVSMS
ncbi:Immunoglobulin I-set [Trinorchestia longiramus]|nr:Immunoglobulin I-set [Trinorchestia longiramus]